MLLALVLACGSPTVVEPTQRGTYDLLGTDRSVDEAMQPAWDAVEKGDAVEGDRLASAVVARLEADPNAGFARAVAHATQGSLRASIGDLERAVASYERALAVPPTTDDERKGRLAHTSMLIEILLRSDRADEALPRARAALEERVAFYTDPGHPGRAYGHRTVAEVLFATGDLEGARQEADASLALFAAAHHFEVHDGVLLVGEIQVASGQPIALPDVPLTVDELRKAVVNRADLAGWEHLPPVLAVLVERFPDERIHGARAGLAWRTGDVAGAMASALWLRSNGSPEGRYEAGLLVARLLEAQDDLAAAEQAYRATCEASAAQRARCLRELGLFLSHDPARKEESRAALKEASASDEPEVKGRALAALGILEAHDGTPEAARAALEGALAVLPPTHPDAVFARDHLRTLGTGTCGCDDPAVSMQETLKAHADEALPGLVGAVVVDPEGNFELTLAREPTEAERAVLAELQERVLAEARWRHEQVYGAGSPAQ